MTMEVFTSVIEALVSLGWLVLMCTLLRWLQKLGAAAVRKEEEEQEERLRTLDRKVREKYE